MFPTQSTNHDRGNRRSAGRFAGFLILLLAFGAVILPQPTISFAEAPAERPAYGLCLPCRVVELRDGDTVGVSFPGSDRVWFLRLIDCWAPEVKGKERLRGMASKANAEKLIAAADPAGIAVFIPAPSDPTNLLAALTFDRIPAWLYLDNRRTLNAEQVKSGHATREKVKQQQPNLKLKRAA